MVSIPQAVSTVATCDCEIPGNKVYCFNTASGKHCCNVLKDAQEFMKGGVSIPQAVSPVATIKLAYGVQSSYAFQYRKR